MYLALAKLSWWLGSGNRKECKHQNGSSLNSSTELNLLELDVLKVPAVTGGNLASSPRTVRKKWHKNEEWKIDKEHDVVIVPSDGGCFSDSESDDLEWLIGWSEPHGPGFLSDDEIDGGFGVLVPCYGRGHGGKRHRKKKVQNNIATVPELYSSESKMYIEQWLSSLQRS